MKSARSILCLLVVLLVNVTPALAQKKGGGGGTTPPPSEAAPAIVYKSRAVAGAPFAVVNADGSHDTTSTLRGFAPSWSPFGSGTALDPYRFVAMGIVETQFELFDVWVESGTVRFQFAGVLFQDSVWLNQPKWSPDGQTIAYTRETRTVETISASSGLPMSTYVPPTGSTVVAHSWFTDSQRLAIVERSESGFSLKVLDTLTGSTTIAVPEGRIKTGAILSMSTQRNLLAIACQADKDRSTYVYTYDFDAAGSSLVRRFAGAYPALSPDGSKVVYSDGFPGYRLRVHDFITGSVTTLPSIGTNPDWRP
jgi:hypothetical protein